jgi:hypothetical protein
MNWLKKGPELKMPKLRMPGLGGSGSKGAGITPPAFLADLYYDLRDRRLLLPIALVVVAIAAVPVLLGGSDPVEPPPVALESGEGTATASASLAVVEANPGLRDYRKRLHSRTATDPFEQRYTGVPKQAQLESTTSTSTGGGGAGSEAVTIEESSTSVEVDTGGSGGSGGGSQGGASPGGSDGGDTARQYELVIDVQITRTETTAEGDEKRGEMEVRKDVPVLTQLPGKKTPVVTTAGANLETERLVFLVSHEVKAISGEFACITRGKICELLEVELGILVEYVYEPSGAHYEVKVTGVDVIPARKRRTGAGRSSRAAFAQAYPGMAAWIGQNFSK